MKDELGARSGDFKTVQIKQGKGDSLEAFVIVGDKQVLFGSPIRPKIVASRREHEASVNILSAGVQRGAHGGRCIFRAVPARAELFNVCQILVPSNAFYRLFRALDRRRGGGHPNDTLIRAGANEHGGDPRFGRTRIVPDERCVAV